MGMATTPHTTKRTQSIFQGSSGVMYAVNATTTGATHTEPIIYSGGTSSWECDTTDGYLILENGDGSIKEKQAKTIEEINIARGMASAHAWCILHRFKKNPVPVQRWSRKIAKQMKRRKQKKFKRIRRRR